MFRHAFTACTIKVYCTMFGYFPVSTYYMQTAVHILSSFFYRTQNGNPSTYVAFTVLRTLTTTQDVNATLTTLSWSNFHFRQRKSKWRFMKPSQQDQQLFRAQMDTEVQTHNDTIAELSGKAGKAGYRNLPVTCDRADYFRFLVQ